jgi:hypothetical protein
MLELSVQTPHIALAICAIAAATLSIISANVMFYKIVDEVNSRLPPYQRHGFLFINHKVFDIVNQHARFFPMSRRRKQMFTWFAVGFALGLVAFLSGIL